MFFQLNNSWVANGISKILSKYLVVKSFISGKIILILREGNSGEVIEF